MLAEAAAADPDKETVPEIAIIKEILLSDLKRAHEARLESLEERLTAFSRDMDSRLAALAARIEAVAADSGQSQKQALAEIGYAINQIALGLRRGEEAPEPAEAAQPQSGEAARHSEEAPPHGGEALEHGEETPGQGEGTGDNAGS
jgi:hypothetical protein